MSTNQMYERFDDLFTRNFCNIKEYAENWGDNPKIVLETPDALKDFIQSEIDLAIKQELDKLEGEICKIELDGGTRFLRDKILEVIRQHKQ